MVVLDKLRLPLKKFLYIVVAFLMCLIIFLGGVIYKKKMAENNEIRSAKQKIARERSDRNNYNDQIEALLKSPNIDSAGQLYNLLRNDKVFYESAGWIQDEVHCDVNVCNDRYVKIKDRLFEYVILKKEDVSYLPIFNETELTYEGVVYPIDMEANIRFKNGLLKIQTCTDFISKSYGLNSLFGAEKSTKLEIGIPENVFSFSKNYEWAIDSGIKKADITFETTDVFMFDLLREYYKNDLIRFRTLKSDDKKLSITLSYYCV